MAILQETAPTGRASDSTGGRTLAGFPRDRERESARTVSWAQIFLKTLGVLEGEIWLGLPLPPLSSLWEIWFPSHCCLTCCYAPSPSSSSLASRLPSSPATPSLSIRSHSYGEGQPSLAHPLMIVDAVQAVSVSALISGNTILGKRPIVLGRRAKSQYNEQHSTNLALKKISLKKMKQRSLCW